MNLRKKATAEVAEFEDSETSLAVAGDGQFEIMKMDKNEIESILTENMGADELTAQDLTRVVVPAGGGTTWRLDTVEGEKELKDLVGIIIGSHRVNAYWEEEFSGGGTPPDCFSDDAVTGVGNPGGPCQSCPLAQFGSGKNGRSKACQQSRLIYLVPKDEILPIVIKAPATSLRNAKKYLLGLTSKRRKFHSIYTKLTLERDKNAEGIEYSKVVLTKVGDVEAPELSAAYAQMIKPYLSRTSRDMGYERNGNE